MARTTKGGPSGPSGPSGPGGKLPRSPRRVGRPTKLAADVIETLEQVFARGGTRAEACAAAGITVQTFQTWLVRADLGHGGVFAELRQRVRAAEAQFRAQLRGAVLRSVVDRAATYDAAGNPLLPGRRGEWRAAAALLDRLDRHGLLRPDDDIADDPPGAAGVPDVIDAETLAPDADDAAVLEARVRTLRRQIAAASADGNHDAVAALTRRVERAEDELRGMRRAAGSSEGDPAQLPEDEFVWQLRTAAEAMPEAHLRAIVDVYLERHRMRLVRDETAANALVSRRDEN